MLSDFGTAPKVEDFPSSFSVFSVNFLSESPPGGLEEDLDKVGCWNLALALENLSDRDCVLRTLIFMVSCEIFGFS